MLGTRLHPDVLATLGRLAMLGASARGLAARGRREGAEVSEFPENPRRYVRLLLGMMTPRQRAALELFLGVDDMELPFREWTSVVCRSHRRSGRC